MTFQNYEGRFYVLGDVSRLGSYRPKMKDEDVTFLTTAIANTVRRFFFSNKSSQLNMSVITNPEHKFADKKES
jgi:hypothetical protein